MRDELRENNGSWDDALNSGVVFSRRDTRGSVRQISQSFKEQSGPIDHRKRTGYWEPEVWRPRWLTCSYDCEKENISTVRYCESQNGYKNGMIGKYQPTGCARLVGTPTRKR